MQDMSVDELTVEAEADKPAPITELNRPVEDSQREEDSENPKGRDRLVKNQYDDRFFVTPPTEPSSGAFGYRSGGNTRRADVGDIPDVDRLRTTYAQLAPDVPDGRSQPSAAQPSPPPTTVAAIEPSGNAVYYVTPVQPVVMGNRLTIDDSSISPLSASALATALGQPSAGGQASDRGLLSGLGLNDRLVALGGPLGDAGAAAEIERTRGELQREVTRLGEVFSQRSGRRRALGLSALSHEWSSARAPGARSADEPPRLAPKELPWREASVVEAGGALGAGEAPPGARGETAATVLGIDLLGGAAGAPALVVAGQGTDTALELSLRRESRAGAAPWLLLIAALLPIGALIRRRTAG